VAIAATYFTTVTNVTTSTALYTTSSTAYNRDLVITNSGVSTLFVAVGAAISSAATTSSYGIPSGGSLVLTECQVPQTAKIYGTSAGTAAASLGWATLVSVI
jgi:hypothetical protein